MTSISKHSTPYLYDRLNPDPIPLVETRSDGLDLANVMKASQALSGEIQLDKFLMRLMQVALEKAEAETGALILIEGEQMAIAARCFRDRPGISESSDSPTLYPQCNFQSLQIDGNSASTDLEIPLSVVQHVRRTKAPLMLNQAMTARGGNFASDPYLLERKPKSLVCLPMLHRGTLKGLIYLENNSTVGAFAGDRLEVLQLLAAQAAISLENAQLYDRIEEHSRTLEQKVRKRTQKLQKEIRVRVQAEAALRESENRYKTLFEDSALQLWEQDFSDVKKYFKCLLAMGVKDFRSFFYHNPNAVFQCLKKIRVLRVNRATYTAFGAASEEEFLKKFHLSYLFSQDFRVLREKVVALAEGKHQFRSEFYYQRSEGTEGYAILHLDVARGYEETLGKVIVSVIDISDRKQTESALKESESKYRALVEACQDMIWSVDAQGRYTFVNPAVKTIYGYEPEEIVGRTFADFAPTESRDRIRAEFDLLLSEKTFFQYEVINISAKNKPIHLLFNTIVRRNSEGHILGATGTASDITKRKQTEQELQKAKESADAANRAKSEFLATMSHELRTPLNAILGFTQVMDRDTTLSPDNQEYLRIISRSGEHLLELINNILEMSKIEAGQIALNEHSFDLFRLLANLEEMLQLKAKSKGLQLIFDTAANVPQYIRADESKLRQVLINLLSNAIKFTQEGGVTLRVGLEQDPELPEARFQSPSAGVVKNSTPRHCLQFEVEDTGSGIAAEELDTLFAPFGQTESGRQSQEGTGLGLPIGRKFVQLMGGDISVDSTLGRGSIFRFEIRLHPTEQVQTVVNSAYRGVIGLEENQPTYRILVADDRPESRLLLVKLMDSLGFEVQEAKNGQEAVVMWESWQPHLIWMDMQMPEMDGYRATQQIKARMRLKSSESSAKTAVIALTASAFKRDRAVVLSVGCDDFVSKPFREELLLEKMAEHLGVRYRFADTTDSSENGESDSGKVTSTDQLGEYLSQMPSEWIAQAYQATLKGSDRMMLQLIEQIPSALAPLARVLKEWTTNFRFDRAIGLLKPIAETQAESAASFGLGVNRKNKQSQPVNLASLGYESKFNRPYKKPKL
jgi:PAS domain S-box-containing protein